MTGLVTFCEIVGTFAGIAALFLACLFAVVIRTRKSSLAWINRLFICFVIALASESLANVLADQHLQTSSQLWLRILVGLAILLCAVLCIPLYKRVRRHPQYDELQAANQQLEYTKRLFKTFLDETPFAAFVVDEQDRFVYANSTLAAMHKTTSDSMIGTTYRDWFSAEVSQSIKNENAVLRKTGQRTEYVTEFVLPSGSATFMANKFILPGPEEQSLIGVVAIEISEELQSKAIDSFLASIVELSPDAIYTVSDTLIITSWNEAAQRIFGYTANEIIGKHAEILAPTGRKQDIKRVISLLEKGAVLKDKEVVHLAQDGTIKHLSLSATKIKSFIGIGSSYAGIARDETEERSTAREMESLNRELDSRAEALSRANAELPLARDQAIEASVLRSSFVESMSHAIRTPLSGILGASELMLDKRLDRETYDSLKTVHESAQALLTIVNDILDLSKLEDELIYLESKPFRPSDLVHDCVKLVQPGAANKQLKLTVTIDAHLPEQVLGDQSKVRQILLNLLGNAIKFTAKGSVAVEVGQTDEDGSAATLRFSVKDSGTGIAPGDAPLLFTPFSRIEKSTKGIKGSGLGLAISKRYVDLMKGTIDFESTKNVGSTFWFAIPFIKVDSEGSLSDTTSNSKNKILEADLFRSGKVLVIEDNPVLSALTMKQLTRFGITADTAADGTTAIEKVKAADFDIILMDVNLPDISGYEVTQAIRQLEAESDETKAQSHLTKQKHIIVAMTAGAMTGDREKALEAGMDDYMAKPVETGKLRETLLYWLRQLPQHKPFTKVNLTAWSPLIDTKEKN